MMFISERKKMLLTFLLLWWIMIFKAGCSTEKLEQQKMVTEMYGYLTDGLLDVWYPVTLDTVHGGFLADFTFDWRPQGEQNKMIVTQTRHVWTTSRAVLFLNNDYYRSIAAHGFKFLKNTMWDREYGGFFTLMDRSGNPLPTPEDAEKNAYGNAFAIYALATYYEMSGDTSTLNLAQKAFTWLDEHSYDPVYGGYFDLMLRDGTSFGSDSLKMLESNIQRASWKDQNSSIHLLEAFTQLYKVWQDEHLRQRLQEMLVLVRDTITTEKGYLTLNFERDWQPVSYRDSAEAVREANFWYDHVSFGHDVETAYLMLEAAHALGIPEDSLTLRIAKKMVDHAIENGWDEENGGFYYQGYYFSESDSIRIINDAKTWWVQAEGLNALLLMAQLFPGEQRYYNLFEKQWDYIVTYLIDHEYGGWYEEGLDTRPEQRQAPKAHIWKVNYHTARTLMNCIGILQPAI